MVNEFVVQVLAGATVALFSGGVVALRRRAKHLGRPMQLNMLGLAASILVAAAATSLVGRLGAPGLGGPHAALELPVVARVEGAGVARRRGFFTPQGHLIAPARDLAVGMAVSVSWPGSGAASTAATVVRVGGCGQSLALLAVPGAPRVDHAVGEGRTLQSGDAVSRFVPGDPASGTVVAAATERGAGECTWLVTTRLNNSHLTHPGDAGAPVLDADGRVVAMIAANDVEQGHTLSIPIEHVREAFPWAFEAERGGAA